MLTTVRVHALALARVLRAWLTLRRWRQAGDGPLHLVPLVGPVDEPGPPITARPTSCWVHITHPGQGTVQPDLVTCWPCAVAYEWAATTRDGAEAKMPWPRADLPEVDHEAPDPRLTTRERRPRRELVMTRWAVGAPVGPGARAVLEVATLVTCRVRDVVVAPAARSTATRPRWEVVAVLVGGQPVEFAARPSVDRLGALLRGRALRPGESIKVVLRNATRRRLRPRLTLTYAARGVG